MTGLAEVIRHGGVNPAAGPAADPLAEPPRHSPAGPQHVEQKISTKNFTLQTISMAYFLYWCTDYNYNNIFITICSYR